MLSRHARIVVTGANGFIGSLLCKKLEDNGYGVVAFDLAGEGKNFFHGSVLEKEKLSLAFSGAWAIVHLAAIPVASSIVDEKESFEVNVNGTRNVLEAALEARVKKIVFASSSLVYGTKYIKPILETAMLAPELAYAEQKVLAERLCEEFRGKGLDITILRFFNVYGISLRQRIAEDISTIFFKKILRGEKILINNAGKNARDFVNARDILRAIILALENKMASNQAFNVGTGKATDIAVLAKKIARLLKKKPNFEFAATGSRAVCVRADTKKAERVLGFKASVSLDNGLKEMAEFFG